MPIMQFRLANNDIFHFWLTVSLRTTFAWKSNIKKTLTEVNKRQNVLLLWAAGVVPVQKCSFWLLLLTAQRCDILPAKVRPSLWSLRLLNQLQTSSNTGQRSHLIIHSRRSHFMTVIPHCCPPVMQSSDDDRPNMHLFPLLQAKHALLNNTLKNFHRETSHANAATGGM